MAEVDFAAVVRSAIEMTVLSANGRGIQVSIRDLELDPAPVHRRLACGCCRWSGTC